VGEQNAVHFQRRALAKATMHLMFPPSPKRRTLCQMGSRLKAITHLLSLQNPRRCEAAALEINSIATEIFQACLWEICMSLKFVLVQQGFLESLMNVVSGRWPSTIQPREHADFQFAFLI